MTSTDVSRFDFCLWFLELERSVDLMLLTLLLECEVFREMAALVVPPEQEECGGVDQLQGPKVDDALEKTNIWR